MASVYKVLVDARDRGLTRAIGVRISTRRCCKHLLDAVEARRASRSCQPAQQAVVQNAFSVAGHPAKHDGVGNACPEGSRLYGSTDETLAPAQRAGLVFLLLNTMIHGLGGRSANVDVLGRREVRRIAVPSIWTRRTCPSRQCGGSSSSASTPCRRRRIYFNAIGALGADALQDLRHRLFRMATAVHDLDFLLFAAPFCYYRKKHWTALFCALPEVALTRSPREPARVLYSSRGSPPAGSRASD